MCDNLSDGISVLICCRNSEDCIEEVLKNISKQSPDEIIIIDGASTDRTIAIASKYSSMIFDDEGKGLGYARKLGVQKIKTKYVCIISPDDVISETFLSDAVSEIKNSSPNIAALLARKKFTQALSFWDQGQDAIYQLVQKFPIRVVGNPSVYKTQLLKDFSYDDGFSANEDTDLCERWARAGYKVDWSKRCCTFEIENRNYSAFKTRYRWYGEGDLRFIKKWYSIDKRVSLRHFLHPLRNYMVKYPAHLIAEARFSAAIFSFLCGVNRYIGLISEILRNLRSK
jgi:glycosyltransferase involved in cell wall biosynthesis